MFPQLLGSVPKEDQKKWMAANGRAYRRRMHVYKYVRERAARKPASASLHLTADMVEAGVATEIQAEIAESALVDHKGKAIRSVTALVIWREHLSGSEKPKFAAE